MRFFQPKVGSEKWTEQQRTQLATVLKETHEMNSKVLDLSGSLLDRLDDKYGEVTEEYHEIQTRYKEIVRIISHDNDLKLAADSPFLFQRNLEQLRSGSLSPERFWLNGGSNPEEVQKRFDAELRQAEDLQQRLLEEPEDEWASLLAQAQDVRSKAEDLLQDTQAYLSRVKKGEDDDRL